MTGAGGVRPGAGRKHGRPDELILPTLILAVLELLNYRDKMLITKNTCYPETWISNYQSLWELLDKSLQKLSTQLKRELEK